MAGGAVVAAVPGGVAQAAPATISGVVTDAVSGLPIAGAVVSASSTTGSGPGTGDTAVTDGTGAYLLDDLDTAYQYRVQFTGPAGQNYITEFYEDEYFATADPVPAPSTNINGALRVGGSIAGTVRDPDGRPMAGVFVNVYDTDGATIDPVGGSGSAQSLADGTYVVNELLAGDYYVAFGDQTTDADPDLYPGEFWNDASTQGAATPVTVTPGNTVTGINAQMDLNFPSAPKNVAGTAGNGSIAVTWQAPTDAGSGSTALNGYVASASPGGQTCTTTGALTCTITGLTNGQPYTITVRGTTANPAVQGLLSDPSAPITPQDPQNPIDSSDFLPLSPGRILETRSGQPVGTVDGQSNAIGIRTAGQVTTLQVTGRANVPPGAEAAVFNVAVTEAQAPGFVTVYPCDKPRPTAANLNYVAGETISNAVTSALSATGTVCIFTFAGTHVVVDVTGAYPAGSDFAAFAPARLLESRSGQPVGTVDNQSNAIGIRTAGQVTTLQVGGRGGVPAGAEAAVFNVAVTEAQAPGFVTVYPCDKPRPTAANLNFVAGQTISNAVTSALSATGTVCIFTFAATHIVVDVTGAYPAGSDFAAFAPARVLETRSGQPVGTVDGQSNAIGIRTAGQVTTLQIAGRAGVPAGADAVVMNVAVTEAQAPGFITVYPCDKPRPTAANLNFVAGQTISNAVTAALSPTGTVCIFTFAATHLVADVNGAF